MVKEEALYEACQTVWDSGFDNELMKDIILANVGYAVRPDDVTELLQKMHEEQEASIMKNVKELADLVMSDEYTDGASFFDKIEKKANAAKILDESWDNVICEVEDFSERLDMWKNADDLTL